MEHHGPAPLYDGCRGSVFHVGVDVSENVGDVKEKVKRQKPISIRYDTHLLSLYLTGRGIVWLNEEQEDRDDMKRGKRQTYRQERLQAGEGNANLFGQDFEFQ